MQPCHTHGHALSLVNLKSLSVDASSLLPILCGVPRAVQAVLQQSAHVFVTWMVIFGRQFDKLFFVLKRRNTPWRLQPRRRSVRLRTRVRLVLLRDPPRAHDGASLVVPLSVPTPVLMGALPVSGRHTSLETVVDIFWRWNVLHFFTSCLGAHLRIKPPAFVVIPVHRDARVSSIHLIFFNNPAHPLYISSFLLLFPRLQLLLILSQLFLHCSGNLTYSMFPYVPFRIVLLPSTRACRCVPLHLLRIRIPTYLALVTVRTLTLTKTQSSFTACGQFEQAQIRHCRSRSWHGNDRRHALLS